MCINLIIFGRIIYRVKMQKMIAVLCLLFELSHLNKFVVGIIYTWLLIINFGSGDLPSPLMDSFYLSMEAFPSRCEKTCLWGLQASKAQTNLGICAVSSAPLLLAHWKVSHLHFPSFSS